MSQQVKVYRTLKFYKDSGATNLVDFDTDNTSSILYVIPETNDTGSIEFGNGTKSMDVKVWMGVTNYALFDTGNARMAVLGNIVPATSDGSALGTTALMFSDLFLASASVINFNNGDVTITHGSNLLTIAGGGITIGADASPAGDFTLFATAAGSKVWLDVDADTNGAFYFGANDYGIDVGFYGQTISNSMIWDASADALVFTAGGITMGTTSKLIIPVKASGSATNGDFWLDTTLYTLNFYANGTEYKVTATAI